MTRSAKKAMIEIGMMSIIAIVLQIDMNFFFVGMCAIISSLVNTCHYNQEGK